MERAGQPAARQMTAPSSHRGDCFTEVVLLLLFTRSRAIRRVILLRSGQKRQCVQLRGFMHRQARAAGTHGKWLVAHAK